MGVKDVEKERAIRTVRLEPVGTILEFDDGKHAGPILGVVQAAEAKGSKGAAYRVRDSNDRLYSITSKQIHCRFPPNPMTLPTDPPAVALHPYLEVSRLKSSELGVDLELLELAWDVCAEEGHEEGLEGHSARAIVAQIDENLYTTPVEQYKTYRLLSSSVGKVFFKQLHTHDYAHPEYKAKTSAAVADSKEALCDDESEASEAAEWCFAT